MFNQITDAIYCVVTKANAYLSDYILIILLIGVGLYFTIATKFVQVRFFGAGMIKYSATLNLQAVRTKADFHPSRHLLQQSLLR